MACITFIVWAGFLTHLAGFLTPGWISVVEYNRTRGESSTNYGLFYLISCSSEGCLSKTIYEDGDNHFYQGDALYPRRMAVEFNASLAVLLNLLALFLTHCATRKNKTTAKMALTTVLLHACSFFVTLSVVTDYLVIHLLATKKFFTPDYPPWYEYYSSRVRTPYSLIIVGVALLIQTSVILYFLWKLRRLLHGLSITNEAPPPYHLLRNEGDGFHYSYGTSNTTQQPSPNAPSYYGTSNTTQQPSPSYYGTSNTTQQPSSNYNGTSNTTQQPAPNAPSYNPFEDDSDQQQRRNENMV
ncbi:uncharacterized protein LOC125664130 [Ostrea edulis]|uniref:uncharacterized protein LOC125664130 n=1 Tax=Ostrea edulis TaxID=37623 RepID=UPI0024AF3BCD|nr:uncharacterized protein LOC125664130 [Ostrea edulis]